MIVDPTASYYYVMVRHFIRAHIQFRPLDAGSIAGEICCNEFEDAHVRTLPGAGLNHPQGEIGFSARTDIVRKLDAEACAWPGHEICVLHRRSRVPAVPHSALMFAALMMGHHFSISDL
jgi:hypothetical protein